MEVSLYHHHHHHHQSSASFNELLLICVSDEISQITDVLTGDDVKDIIGTQQANKHPLNQCISIKFGGEKSLDLIASSGKEAKMWIYGLQTLMENKSKILILFLLLIHLYYVLMLI